MQPYIPNQSTPPDPPRQTARLPLLLALLLVLTLLFLAQSQLACQPDIHDPRATPRPITARGDLAADEQSTIELFQQSSHSVVNINSVAAGLDFGLRVLEVPRGTGSGIVWDEQGYIVTNYHVVENADRWQVTLADQSSWSAVMVGAVPDKDLAVLKIDAPRDRLIPILVGTSEDLLVGQKVFAIGNPFGLDQTLTTGVISGLGRQIEARAQGTRRRTIDGIIQSDAAINPGNSGGPLLDSAGRLIGLNTAIYSPTGASAGIGFSIPVDTINRIVPQIIREGRVIRPGLGVNIAPDPLARQLGLEGILVIDVPEGSAAAEAGIQPTRRGEEGDIQLGDVIVAIDGQRVRTENELLSRLEQYQVDDTVTVTVLRDARTRRERELDLPLTLQMIE